MRPSSPLDGTVSELDDADKTKVLSMLRTQAAENLDNADDLIEEYRKLIEIISTGCRDVLTIRAERGGRRYMVGILHFRELD